MNWNFTAALAGALTLIAAEASAQEPVYSSIKAEDCILYDIHEVGAATACRGVGGFNLAIDDGDLRIYLGVAHPDFELTAKIDLMKITGGSFSSLPGDVVEWRGPVESPTAMILRIGYNEGDGKPGDQAMAVIRLDKTGHERTCLVGVVPRGPEMNAEARRVADEAAGLPCL